MITKLIKNWIFEETEREKTTIISPLARLNTELSRATLELKQQGLSRNGFPIYSTDANISIKTRLYEPHSLTKWEMFECIWFTNEFDGVGYKEYNLDLSNKTGSVFDADFGNFIPKIGDKVYQGDFQTTISIVADGKITLANATDFVDGRAYFLRSNCDVLFRVYDKSGQEWKWDGANWVHAGSTDWNTQFEINNNIASFPIATEGKGFGFYINLKTVDELFTPIVKELKLLGEFDIVFQEDMIFDSIIPTIEEKIEASTLIELYLESATTVVDLATTYKLEREGYNFTDGLTVYNLDTDPEKVNNLFDSYTPGAARKGGGKDPGQITLTSSQPADSKLSIQMKYFPEIAVNTSPDFYEVEVSPSMVFESIMIQNPQVAEDSTGGKDLIRDKIKLTGVEIKPPAQNDLLFEYAVFTGGQTDQHRIGEALRLLFNSINHIDSWGLDEPYTIIVRDVFRSTNQPNASSVNTHVGSFLLKNMISSIGQPRDVYLVGNFGRTMTTKQN